MSVAPEVIELLKAMRRTSAITNRQDDEAP